MLVIRVCALHCIYAFSMIQLNNLKLTAVYTSLKSISTTMIGGTTDEMSQKAYNHCALLHNLY